MLGSALAMRDRAGMQFSRRHLLRLFNFITQFAERHLLCEFLRILTLATH